MSALDEFAALADRLLWRTIDSAPKMRVVLLWAATARNDDGKIVNWKMATGSYNQSFNAWEWDGRIVRRWEVSPTHWMPLPAPPPEIES